MIFSVVQKLLNLIRSHLTTALIFPRDPWDSVRILSQSFSLYSYWVISSNQSLSLLTVSVISILLFNISREIYILVIFFLILILHLGFLYVVYLFAETFHPSIHFINVCTCLLEHHYNWYFGLCQIIPNSVPSQSGNLLNVFSHASWDFPVSLQRIVIWIVS